MAFGGSREGPVGVVLAGGESRRMGRDKALLPWRGGTLAQHARDRLAAVCAEVVVADRGRGVVAGAHSVADGAGAGPAAGLLGAAATSPGRSLLVLACDLPFVPVGLLLALARLGAGADLVMPVSSRGPEPLAAFYGPSALAALTMAVARGELALNRLLEDGTLRVLRLEVARLSRHGDPALLFQNVNTAADWRAAESAGF